MRVSNGTSCEVIFRWNSPRISFARRTATQRRTKKLRVSKWNAEANDSKNCTIKSTRRDQFKQKRELWMVGYWVSLDNKTLFRLAGGSLSLAWKTALWLSEAHMGNGPHNWRRYAISCMQLKDCSGIAFPADNLLIILEIDCRVTAIETSKSAIVKTLSSFIVQAVENWGNYSQKSTLELDRKAIRKSI